MRRRWDRNSGSLAPQHGFLTIALSNRWPKNVYIKRAYREMITKSLSATLQDLRFQFSLFSEIREASVNDKMDILKF